MSAFDSISIYGKLLTAGTSACIADAITFPLDTAKVRLQVNIELMYLAVLSSFGFWIGYSILDPNSTQSGDQEKLLVNTQGNLQDVNLGVIQGEATSLIQNGTVAILRTEAQSAQLGLYGMITNMVRHEGPRSLYSGLSAGLQRQMCFASVRIGLYDSFKAFYQQLIDGNTRTGSLNIGARVAAGLTTGGLAVLIAQPTDVVKVRFQASVSGKSAIRYKSTMQAYKSIATTEGARGLWKGTFPNVSRNAIVNVSEIVCYDLIKDTLLYYHLMKDGIILHFTSAVIAGFCTTVVASPVDVVKTRYMNSPEGQYKGAVDCAVRMFMQEGGKAFYKGFIPSFCRLVSWNIMMWVTYEQMKLAVGNSFGKVKEQ